MKPIYHITFGFVFSVVLAFFFSLGLWQFATIFLSSIFIDIDHVFWYIFWARDISPRRCLKEFDVMQERRHTFSKQKWARMKYPLFVFHGLEVLTILLVLSFFNQFFLFVAIGFAFHLVLDYVHVPYDNIPFGMKISPVYVFFRNFGKKSFSVKV